MSIFSQFQVDKVKIIKKDQSYTSPEIQAQVDNNIVRIEQDNLPAGVDIEDGDYIDRILPNNKFDRYEVIDAGYKEGWEVFPASYECRVKKVNQVSSEPKNVTYNVNGHNARVYHNSSDNSTNTVALGQQNVFDDLRNVVQNEILSDNERLLAVISEMEEQQGKPTFTKVYKEFVSLAADHLSLLTPFLPAITKLIK